MIHAENELRPSSLRVIDQLEEITLQYENGSVLGRGGFGLVFKGKYRGVDVATKRIERYRTNESYRELYHMLTFNHVNVLKLLKVKERGDFW
jgi:predicted Ser/Thr protein kinase